MCDVIGTILSARAFNISLPFAGAIVFVGAVGISSAIPSAPGSIGLYQFIAATILPLYGASKTASVLFGIVSHAFTYAVVIIWGLFGMVHLQLKIERARVCNSCKLRRSPAHPNP